MPPSESKEGATPAPKPPEKKLVKVKVVGPNPIGEDGVAHEKGATFETTPQRRKALGALVTDVE